MMLTTLSKLKKSELISLRVIFLYTYTYTHTHTYTNTYKISFIFHASPELVI